MSSTNQFAALGVEPDIVEVLTKRGITEPFEIQALSIEDSLSGRDVCGGFIRVLGRWERSPRSL